MDLNERLELNKKYSALVEKEIRNKESILEISLKLENNIEDEVLISNLDELRNETQKLQQKVVQIEEKLFNK